MSVLYRQGGKQPRNIYRVTDEHPEGQYIGVFFEERDAATAVRSLNADYQFWLGLASKVISDE